MPLIIRAMIEWTLTATDPPGPSSNPVAGLCHSGGSGQHLERLENLNEGSSKFITKDNRRLELPSKGPGKVPDRGSCSPDMKDAEL